MNKTKKWLAHVLTLAMVICSISVLSFGQQAKSEAASGSFQNLNQSQFVSAMGAGWNLGNQLEAANNGVPSETAWGNPTITENLIKAVKKRRVYIHPHSGILYGTHRLRQQLYG